MVMQLAHAKDLGMDFQATDRGLEVTAVKPGSPACRVGLEVGDVIVTVHGYPVTSAEKWDWLMSGGATYIRLGVLDCRTNRARTLYVCLE
jgi:C-terminal processing protease CtpA/Prc